MKTSYKILMSFEVGMFLSFAIDGIWFWAGMMIVAFIVAYIGYENEVELDKIKEKIESEKEGDKYGKSI